MKEPPFAKRWRQTMAKLGNYKHAVLMLENDPTQITTIWSDAHRNDVSDNERRRAIELLNRAFGRLSAACVVRFAQSSLSEPPQGQPFPGCFYRELSAEAICHLSTCLQGCQQAALCFTVSEALFRSGNPSLVEIFGRLRSAQPHSPEAHTLFHLVSTCLAHERMPFPALKSSYPAVQRLRAEGRLERAADGQRVVRDPKGNLTLHYLPWVLPEHTGEPLIAGLKAFVEGIIGLYRMPQSCLALVRQAKRERDKLQADIDQAWSNLQRAAACSDGLSIRRWLPPKGLATMEVVLAGEIAEESGLKEVIFHPERCQIPCVAMDIVWFRLGWGVIERSEILSDGRLDILSDYEPNSEPWALRLLLNRLILEKLFCLATRPARELARKSRTGVSSEGNGQAVFPHIRCLPHGYLPSAEALERGRAWGLNVPEGYTVAGSPPLRTRNTHPDLKPIILKFEVNSI